MQQTDGHNVKVNGLRQRLNDALSQSGYPRVRAIQIGEVNDSIKLVGTVSFFFEKQQAQEAIRQIAGKKQIVNEIQVR